MRLDHAMRQALAHGRFRLHYQPQVDMAAAACVGAEALLRWRDPELGEVSPGEFIPVAEESGFIVAIGDWVLRQAVQQAARWHAAGHRAAGVRSTCRRCSSSSAGFVDRVAAALREAGLPPALLELELTESILMQDAARSAAAPAARWRSSACKLAIDDFGTGYSSLGLPEALPDRAAEDRPQLRRAACPADESDAGIVSAIVQLARALQPARSSPRASRPKAQRAVPQHERLRPVPGLPVRPALDASASSSGCASSRRRPDPARGLALSPGAAARGRPCPQRVYCLTPMARPQIVRKVGADGRRSDPRRHEPDREPD